MLNALSTSINHLFVLTLVPIHTSDLPLSQAPVLHAIKWTEKKRSSRIPSTNPSRVYQVHSSPTWLYAFCSSVPSSPRASRLNPTPICEGNNTNVEARILPLGIDLGITPLDREVSIACPNSYLTASLTNLSTSTLVLVPISTPFPLPIPPYTLALDTSTLPTPLIP